MKKEYGFFKYFLINTRNFLLYYFSQFLLHAKLCIVSIMPRRNFKLRKFPLTIQLPITWKCNFNCVMCGMNKLVGNEDFSSSTLKDILSDKLFSKVVSVGINGGEPFLKKDLVECVNVMIETLPKLKTINIISNGFFTKSVSTKLREIKSVCSRNNIIVNLSLSVDGIGDTQDFMRGLSGAWSHVNETIDMILDNQSNFCDSLGIICTVTRHNIANIEEVESWSKSKKLRVSYNIATVNARIDNFDKVNDFSIFSDKKSSLLAQEFFYKKFIEDKSKRYFGIYYFIRYRKRISFCDCQFNRWVTLTPDSCISYCATHSKILGNALDKSAYDIFNDNVDYLMELRSEYCSTCSHYMWALTKDGLKEYFKELIRYSKIIK